MKLLSEVCSDDGALAALAHATQAEGMHTTAISLHQELFLRCICDNPEVNHKICWGYACDSLVNQTIPIEV